MSSFSCHFQLPTCFSVHINGGRICIPKYVEHNCFYLIQILTAHRRWEVYRGDSSNSKDLLFSAKKSSMLQLKTELDVFLAANTKEDVPDFKVKGSWFERSCTIYLGNSSTIIAQVRLQSPLLFQCKSSFCVSISDDKDY